MVKEYLTDKKLDHFFEKLMIFDDWNQSLPIITPERVRGENEAKIEFFSVPVAKRGVRLNYTD